MDGGTSSVHAGPMAKEDEARARPVQERAVATRNRLLEAGLHAFAEKGHLGVSLAVDILEPAGVSVGSFYHQFANKTDLLVAVLEEHAWDRRRAITLALSDGEPTSLEAAVRQGFAALFDDFDDNEPAWRVLHHCRGSQDPAVRATVAQGHDAWIAQSAAVLRPWMDAADDDQLEDLSTVLLAFADGLAAVYLDLPDAERRARRPRLEAGAVLFTLGAVEDPVSS